MPLGSSSCHRDQHMLDMCAQSVLEGHLGKLRPLDGSWARETLEEYRFR